MSRPLALRRARQSEGALLLKWRNDPTTRAASGKREEISEAEHAAWLEAVLADPDRHLLIAEADGVPVGQVRLERRRGSRYELSVSLDRAERGRGAGARLIAEACEWAWAATDATEIEAWVRADNERSLRAFERAGFGPGSDSRPGFASLSLGRPQLSD